jgi:hypothetical protein
LALVLAVGWSLAWLFLMHETERRLDAWAADRRAGGWQVSWASRHTGGYPFRLDVDLNGLVVADPSGWGLAAPALKAEAYAFAPTHWVFFLPGGGFTLTRPAGGPIDVAARVFRGSVSGVGEGDVPQIALEGDDMRFTPGPGGAPVTLAAAKNLQVYSRPGPDDQGAALLTLDGASAAPGSWLAQLSGTGAVDLKTDVTFSHVGAFAAPGWRAAALAWAHAGGAMNVEHFQLTAGTQTLASTSGSLTLGDDGRVAGQLALTAQGQPLALRFKDGAVWAGQTRVAASPRLF